MKKHFLFLSLISTLLFLTSCQKELSYENGGIPSEGSLQSDVTGDCLPKNVAGIYEAGTALTATNFIEVQVNVTKAGAYVITSDTLNGVFFRATGVFTATGLTTVKLKGTGTPVADGVNNYTILYKASFCSIAVTTLPAGAAKPAVFTLAGSPTACMLFNLSGTYTVNVALNSPGNKVVLNVNVTTPGTYNISTTQNNGITFSGLGSLSAAGAATITLTASGTPAVAGTTNISVTTGTSTCSFPVTVTGPAAFTVNCTTAVVDGDYTEGVALDASNTIQVNVNVTTAGGYTITGTINGMTFTGTGTFATATPQTITLTGTGKPTAAGNFNVPLMSGTTSLCSVPITVDPATSAGWSGNWQFTQGGTTYSGTFSDGEFDNTTAPPLLIVWAAGMSANNETLELDFVDVSGSIGVENYNNATFTGTSNTGGFYFDGIPPLTLYADFTIAGNTMLTKVTSHNTATKTITGTFSGKAEDDNGVLKDITLGTFTIKYP